MARSDEGVDWSAFHNIYCKSCEKWMGLSLWPRPIYCSYECIILKEPSKNEVRDQVMRLLNDLDPETWSKNALGREYGMTGQSVGFAVAWV